MRVCVCVLPPGKTVTGRIYPVDVRISMVEQAKDKFLFSDMSGKLDKVIGYVIGARKVPDDSVVVEFDVVDAFEYVGQALEGGTAVARPSGHGREHGGVIDAEYELDYFGVVEP